MVQNNEPFALYWKHSAELVDKQNGIAISLLFRVGNNPVPVYKSSNLLVNPNQSAP